MSNEEKADYIRRLGNASSIALLHPQCKIFHDSAIDGIMGYRDEPGCIVILGDPLCGATDIPELTHRFHNHCKDQKKNIVYVAASDSFTQWSLANTCSSALEFGHEIIIDPTIDTRLGLGKYPRLLRQKHKYAMRDGVIVKEYTASDSFIEGQLMHVAQTWLANRKGPQMHMIPLDVFAYRHSKRWFYAECRDQIVGLLMLNRMDAYDGWVMNGGIMLTPDAPYDTSEFLMMNTLGILRAEGCHFFSVGPTFGAEIGKIIGFGKFSQLIIRTAVKSLRSIFKYGEHQRYWKKFEPRKESAYVVFEKPKVGISEIRAVIRAFNVNI